MSSNLESHGYNSTTKTTETQIIDKEVVRQRLRDEGSVCLTESDPDERSCRYVELNKIECNFEGVEMNHYNLCRKLEKEILAGVDDGSEIHTGMPIGLNLSVQKDYGVVYPSSSSWAGFTTQKQFVRSIFLLFTRATGEVIADEDGSRKKKARSAPSQKITIGMAHSSNTLEDGRYCRTKKIIRFYSANETQIEIHIESRHMISPQMPLLRRRPAAY